MRSVRSWVLGLALLGCVTTGTALVPELAMAQPGPGIFAAPGLVELVPAGDVIADGRSPVLVYVIALNPDGTPMVGLVLKAGASQGVASGWSEVAPGMYSFTYTAPALTAPGVVTLDARGKTADKQTIAAVYKLPVRPATATGLQVVSNPPQVVLGQDGEASISVVLQGAAGAVAVEDLAIRASSGEIQNVTHLGDGRFSARFVPPKVNFPQLAIVSAVDLRNPDRVYGAVAIPLQGKTDYPVQAEPGSNVVLRIAGREFGPVQALPTGRAAVPVIVPPGVQEATKVEVRGGQTLEDKIDLRVPETRRIAILPTARALPADGLTEVPVRVAVFTPDGRPELAANVTFAATGATVNETRNLGNGLYEARIIPRFSAAAGTATLSASLVGSSVQTDTLEVKLVPARPASVALTAQPDRLTRDATGVRLFAKVLASNGTGMDRRELVLAIAGATAKEGVQDLRNGDYRVDLSATPGTNVDIVATVRNPATGNPLSRVLLFPDKDVVPNDGSTARRISVVTVDQFGFPVPDVEVKLQIETGDGSIQNSVKTNDGGVGQVYYTPGRGAGLVRLRARAGNRTAVASVLQAPASLSAITLPTPGDPTDVALSQAWEKLVVPLRILRDGAGEGVARPTDVAGAQAGALARIEARSEPATAAAGGRINLLIDAKDAGGLGVAGLPFDLIVSPGQAGAVADLGGGKYQATITVPPGAVGELKVSVASGDTASFVKIPISGVAAGGSAWGADPGTGPVTPPLGGTVTPPLGGTVTPPLGGTVTPPSTPSASDADLTEVRVRAGYVFSSYVYEQAPLPDNGPLLPAVISIGGKDGQGPGVPQGFEVAGRGWLIPYVGFDAGLRSTFWSFTAPEFGGGVVQDSLIAGHVNAMARYPFQSGTNTFWLGARAGWQGGTIVYLTGDSLTTGTIEYQALFVQGVDGGLEVGADVGDLYLYGAVQGRTVGVSRWLGVGVDTHAGYDVTENVFLDVGFGYQDRAVTVLGDTTGAELGTLNDRQVMGKLSVGARF